ncbi:putative ribonuclease H-like domain-containing protein [Tanacetum coccineum]
MQKNLLKQQFETFVVRAREELDSAYDRFQNIISMLELYDAKVSCEDANLKFLRSLPSVWHVVATMIRGQPGLDELDFDDLYNNLKVYEHELKGASSSNSQRYAQASSSKLKETHNSSFNSDEIICSFFAQQAFMPETHDDEDLLQIDDDAMEEIDIRWQVAIITARIRKKENCSIEDSNSKALVAKDSQGEIDWTKEFDDDPVTFAMVALNGIEEDDWSIEIDADHVDLGQDGLDSEESNNSSGDETLTGPLYENFKREKAYKAVPPPTGTIIPPRADVAFTGIDELAKKKKGRIRIRWVDSDDEEVTLGFSEIKKQTILKSETSSENKSPRSKDNFGQRSRRRGLGNRDGKGNPEEELKDHAIIDSGCSGSRQERQGQTPDFKELSMEMFMENLVLLRAPRKNDVYSLNLKSIIPSGGVTCLVAKASEDEAILWHRRLGHVNFKNINKLVKSNLVRGLPSKTFKHDHSCLACRKGKQHKASCKKLEERTVREPLELLHMDLFRPVSVASLNRKKYCLVVTDDCRTDNQEKDEKQRQNDKTGLGMEKTVKDKAKSKPESQSSQKVNRKFLVEIRVNECLQSIEIEGIVDLGSVVLVWISCDSGFRARLGTIVKFEVDLVLSCGCLCLLFGVAMHWADFQEMLLSTIRRDPEREVGYGITNTWDEMLEDMPGAPATDETELGRRMTNFVNTVRQDTYEIYVRLGDAHDERLTLLESNEFFFWKARFETYVNSKDFDLWRVIQNGDFYYEVEDSKTKLMKETQYELLEDDQKKKLGNNDPDYSSKNHVRKFLRALPLKSRAQVTAIEKAKDLATLLLDELIRNLKVYEVLLDNDGVGSKTTKEKVNSLALKAKVTREQISDESDSQEGSDEDVDEEEEV